MLNADRFRYADRASGIRSSHKGSGQRQCLFETGQVDRPRNLFGPKREEVPRSLLDVEEGEPPLAKPLDEVEKGHLGRIGRARKHRFPREEASYGYAIEPAHQLSTAPTLDRVRVTASMQAAVGSPNLIGNPCGRTIRLRLCAPLNNFGKARVYANFEHLSANLLREGAGHVKAIEFQYRSRVGREPRHQVVGEDWPGKDPRTIGEEESLDRKIPPDRDQAIRGGGRRIRECELAGQDRDHPPIVHSVPSRVERDPTPILGLSRATRRGRRGKVLEPLLCGAWAADGLLGTSLRDSAKGFVEQTDQGHPSKESRLAFSYGGAGSLARRPVGRG